MTPQKNEANRSSQDPDTLVCIMSNRQNSKFYLLENALAQSGFWDLLEKKRAETELEKKDFSILIKPDMEAFEADASTCTDPELVEHLIHLLAQSGYRHICVADALDESDRWLENRDVPILAELLGYRFATEDGFSYAIYNLSEAVIEEFFPAESALAKVGISEYWLNAHFRIIFAKNKTDEANRFALCLQNLLHILPQRAKHYHYHNRLDAKELAVDLLQFTEIDFALIDAFVSNDGSQGIRAKHPNFTQTIIASNHILLADWVGALKMGLDPSASPLNAAALRRLKLPKKYHIKGDLNIYPDWKNVSLPLSVSVGQRNASPMMQNLSQSWFQRIDSELFPFKNLLDAQVNNFASPLLQDLDGHPLAYWSYVMLNYALGGLNRFQENWRILYDKDQLRRRETALGIEINQYKDLDYEEVKDYILPFVQIAESATPDANGLRWRYIEESVVFEYSKVIPIDYELFISKVAIHKAVQLMYDNIGGVCIPVKMDDQNRVLFQAERDVYLPQPNWMTLFNGSFIDVCKLEYIDYQEDSQTMYWRTVASPNDSAQYDDGMVTFQQHAGGTLVQIVARQQFELPLFWQALKMDYFPQIKDVMVSDAYIRFFSRTMANYEAAWEGRDPRLGRDWDTNYGNTDQTELPPWMQQMKEVFSLFSNVIEKWVRKNDPAIANKYETDANGYRHFPGKEEEEPDATEVFRSFASDLTSAIGKDIRFLTQPKS